MSSHNTASAASAAAHGLEAANRLLHCRYSKCRENLRSAKTTIRSQATKSRQLIAAVTDQLTRKDEEIVQVWFNFKLF